MRYYRPPTRAEKDARIERRIAEYEAAGIEPRYAPLPRQPARLTFEVDGQSFEAIGKPARRCNQFAWTLNGKPIGIGGAEVAWREIQRQRAPMLGTRNLQ